MPKKFIKRWMPDSEKVRSHPHLNKVFGTLLHDPNLLHLNRRSVSGAFFVGLLMAFVPLPTQMLFAAAAAIFLRVNLPISIGLVWLTNPFTMPPIFYFCYKVGAWVLETPITKHTFSLSWTWLQTELGSIWQPFLLGCLICGLISAVTGALLIRLLWRCHVIYHWHKRKQRREVVK
ncbi:MAG: DUF2062 domain-containing protein [Gammaproteobacteria bacterium]|jgi:uncharacterized protein